MSLISQPGSPECLYLFKISYVAVQVDAASPVDFVTHPGVEAAEMGRTIDHDLPLYVGGAI